MVLLVEDDLVVSLAITEALVAAGIKVACVDTVGEALVFVEKHQPELLLLDYLLPDGTAFDFLDRTLELQRSLPPFVVLTGSGDEQIAVALMKRGARDYLVKDGRLLDVLPLAVQKAQRDIALERELQQTREQLQHNEELLRCTFDQAAVGMVFFALDGHLLRYNLRYAEIVGYPFDELERLTFQEIMHPDDADAQQNLLEQLLKEQDATIAFEKLYTHRDGTYSWAGVTISLVRSVTGQPSHLFAVVKDMTVLKKTIQQLQYKENHLLLAQELAKMASFDWDLVTGRIDWTPQGYEMLERTPGTFPATVESWVEFVHPQDRAALKFAIDQALFEGHEPYAEYRLLMPDGRCKHVTTKAEVLRSTTGQPERLVGVTLDLTDRFAYEAMLEESKSRAEAASRAKTEFLANMSHEIRTPLNGILGMLQLLETSDLDDEQHEYVSIAARSSWGLLQLLNDLLDLSRIEAGHLVIRDELFNLRDLVDNCLALFNPTAQAKGLNLTSRLAKDVPRFLVGDETRIRQILFNLVGNAVKFTATGEVRVEINLLAPSRKDRLRLGVTVVDTGIGMSQQMLEKAFEPFTQEEGTYQRNFQGAGLGLSIVKRLSELMHGNVVIEAPTEGGLRVAVVIEVGMASSVAVTQAAEAESVLRSTGQVTGKLQILLAEDNAVNRLMLKKMLQNSGHTVDDVENGRAVLEALDCKKYNLVMMDIQMSEMDGLEATRRIRSDCSGGIDPDIPIIAVTAYALPNEQQAFLDAGIDACLTKPVAIAELHALLERLTSRQPGARISRATG